MTQNVINLRSRGSIRLQSSRSRARATGKLLTALAFGMLCAGAPAPAEAAELLYGYRGQGGVITFTTRKPSDKAYWIVQRRRPAYSKFISRGGAMTTMRPTRSKFDALIKKMASSYMLEPALVKAVVHAESAFNPKALSPKGAQGLMQLMPDTARRFGIRNAYSPIDNVVGGVRYLRWLYERFDGNITHVIAGYNAGEGAVDRYNGIPPYSETKEYVRRVLKLRDSYRCDFHGQKKC